MTSSKPTWLGAGPGVGLLDGTRPDAGGVACAGTLRPTVVGRGMPPVAPTSVELVATGAPETGSATIAGFVGATATGAMTAADEPEAAGIVTGRAGADADEPGGSSTVAGTGSAATVARGAEES